MLLFRGGKQEKSLPSCVEDSHHVLPVRLVGSQRCSCDALSQLGVRWTQRQTRAAHRRLNEALMIRTRRTGAPARYPVPPAPFSLLDWPLINVETKRFWPLQSAQRPAGITKQRQHQQITDQRRELQTYHDFADEVGSSISISFLSLPPFCSGGMSCREQQRPHVDRHAEKSHF